MKTQRIALLLAMWLGFIAASQAADDLAAIQGNKVLVVSVEGVIGPATAELVASALQRAAAESAGLLVLEMDTPGGLDSSMRLIIKGILSSPVPILTFVSPEGARAASAGTFILYASHIAAMAPATNLGAASPVSIGLPGAGGTPEGESSPGNEPGGNEPGETQEKRDEASGGTSRDNAVASRDAMASKVTNDAAAYIRGLAVLRGRDVEFAERAVREAASLSAHEALETRVIEYIARDLTDLLAQVDGREVVLDSGNRVTLATAEAPVERIVPGWRHQLLALISNPQVALVLMMIGIYGLFFEFTSPGFGVPGVAGLICLLVALYSFQMLPVNWAGVALIALGALLMLAEAFLPSFGVLGIGGIVAFVVGGLFLVDSDVPGLAISLPFLVSLAITSALLLFAIGFLAVRSRGRQVVSGREEMIGAIGTVSHIVGDDVYAHIHGEEWKVCASSGLALGDKVRVTAMDGLKLRVQSVTANDHAT